MYFNSNVSTTFVIMLSPVRCGDVVDIRCPLHVQFSIKRWDLVLMTPVLRKGTQQRRNGTHDVKKEKSAG